MATKAAAPPALEGIEVALTPDLNFHELRPEPLGVSPSSLGLLWHLVSTPGGAKLSLRSADGAAHKLRIFIDSPDRRWRPSWTRWFYAARMPRELQGGDAAAAQDEVLDDGRTLQMMVFADETRAATLEFSARLDGETPTGAYPFDLVVRDITHATEGAIPETRVAGTLSLVHPRANLLDQLPALYADSMAEIRRDQTDETEPPFFERYLRGFEDAHEPLKAALDSLDRIFGPFSTPPDFLLWLAVWVCMPFDENWPDMKRRKLIHEAVELYRWRGTRQGLARYIKIYTGAVPEINDQPVEGMRLGPATKLGTPATKLGDIRPHTFTVTLAVPDPNAINEEIVHDIIRYEKPAHTAYALRIVRKSSGSD